MTHRQSDLMEFLPTVALLRNAPERAVELTAAVLQERNFPAGHTVFQEGDTGEALYIMQSGLVKLANVDLSGHEKTLALLQPPEFFGEMALVGDAKRSATAQTLAETRCWLLYRDDFLRLLETFPTLSLNLTQTLADRLRGMDDEAQILSYKDAQGRVAWVLLRLHESGVAQESESGAPLVRLTHQELASLAGTSRETVTRALRALEAEDVIETRTREIILTDLEGLSEILHGLR
ncbi:MAG TPA: Crp/Fnr family transcriptional regulator [Deinococcales bacterium]|nr:Crp/Fnr family transcriptional regulator [Deinococcales bacterium]